MRVYLYILEYKTEHDGLMPSIRDIGEHCDISSSSVVAYYLDCLERAGQLRRLEDNTLVVVGGRWVAPGGSLVTP